MYRAGQPGFRSGLRSPANGDVHGNSNVEFDDTQLRGMLWHESGLIPSWDIEEWGWCNEGMSDPERDADGFALLVGDKTYAFGLAQSEIEAAMGFALKLCAEARKGGANAV